MKTVTTIIDRADQSQVKIVAQEMFSAAGLHRSVDVCVYHRQMGADNWVLCSSTPKPGWMEMSVDDYVKNGRSDMLRAASPIEIMKVLMHLLNSKNDVGCCLNQQIQLQ